MYLKKSWDIRVVSKDVMFSTHTHDIEELAGDEDYKMNLAEPWFTVFAIMNCSGTTWLAFAKCSTIKKIK